MLKKMLTLQPNFFRCYLLNPRLSCILPRTLARFRQVLEKAVDTATIESILTGGNQLPNLNHLSHAEKDALIHALCAQVQGLTARVVALEAKLNEPSKSPDNSSLPPSQGQKPNKPEKAKRVGPRQGSLGCKGGGRPLAFDPDETVTPGR